MRHGPVRVGATALLTACVAWVGSAEAPAGEKKDDDRPILVSIQGVLASKGKDAKNPQLDPSLAAYREVLVSFPGFGKFEDIGRDSGAAKPNQPLVLKVGSHTIEVILTGWGRTGPKINYTIKDSKGKEIGCSAVVLTAGQVVPVQVGDPAVPVILIFRSGRHGGGP
jgi:hypothetical protein